MCQKRKSCLSLVAWRGYCLSAIVSASSFPINCALILLLLLSLAFSFVCLPAVGQLFLISFLLADFIWLLLFRLLHQPFQSVSSHLIKMLLPEASAAAIFIPFLLLEMLFFSVVSLVVSDNK